MDKRQRERLEKKRKNQEYKAQRHIELARESKPLETRGAEPRSCGECQACCYVVAVHTLPEVKPNYARCPHQCESGCGIYSSRPKECRDYYCLYQSGILTGGEEMRPDRLGVLLDFRTAHGNESGRARDVIVFWETRKGAMQEEPVRQLVKRVRGMGIHIAYNEFDQVRPDDDGRVTRYFRKSLL
jgi:hypothetical protein